MKAFEERVTRYVNQATFRHASISGAEDNRQQITEKFSFAGILPPRPPAIAGSSSR